MSRPSELGTAPIGQLLRQQAIPASIGILVLSIYGIVDSIFVGQYVGSIGLGAITVVLPITYLIASVGMSIGIGGGSVISRAFGAQNDEYAQRTFGNQVTLVLLFAAMVVSTFYIYSEEILKLFGGKGDILPAAKTYFRILLPAIPFLAWSMMSNNVFRAEGKPRIAMVVMLVPAIINLLLDPIFIVWLDMGLEGAALATSISYVCSAVFCLWNFITGRSALHLSWSAMKLKWEIVREIFALGGVTLARQSVVSLLAIVLNNTLFIYGNEPAVAVYGIIQRVMMFANFPVLGINQGFIPIAGYNFGAQKWGRVRGVVVMALKVGTLIALGIFMGILLFSEQLVRLFTSEPDLIEIAVPALRVSFIATPLILFQLVSSAYFQAIGRARPALFLTLTKQGFCLLPLVYLLPKFFGLDGVWWAFPIADVLSAAICFYFLWGQMKKLHGRQIADGEATSPVLAPTENPTKGLHKDEPGLKK